MKVKLRKKWWEYIRKGYGIVKDKNIYEKNNEEYEYGEHDGFPGRIIGRKVLSLIDKVGLITKGARTVIYLF